MNTLLVGSLLVTSLAGPAPTIQPGFCQVGAGSKFLNCQYRISWAADGQGVMDTLTIKDTLAVASIVLAKPVSPVVVVLTYPIPMVGIVLQSSVTAQLTRRGLKSNLIRRQWNFRVPDIPPPDPVIDTVVIIGLTIEKVRVNETEQALCPVFTLAGGIKAMRAGDATGPCGPIRAPFPMLSPAKQASLDKHCLRFRHTAADSVILPTGDPGCDVFL